MANETYTIPLNEEDKQFYRNVYIARKIKEWYEQYQIMWCVEHGYTTDFIDNHSDKDECYVCEDEFINNELMDKETMKFYLNYIQYMDYLEFYDEIFTKTIGD